jgi:hypothetical protein
MNINDTCHWAERKDMIKRNIIKRFKTWFLVKIINTCPICGCKLSTFDNTVDGVKYKRCTNCNKDMV